MPVINQGLLGSKYMNMIPTLGAEAWSPANLSSTQLLQWLDATDESTITLNGSDVSNWSDKSGNAKHAAQATAANQPTYETGETLNYIDYPLAQVNYLTSSSVANVDGVHSFLIFKTAHQSEDLIHATFRFAFRLWNGSAGSFASDSYDSVYKNGNLVTVTTGDEGYDTFGTDEIVMGEIRGYDYSNAVWLNNDWNYGSTGGGFQYEGRLYEIIHLAPDTPIVDIQRVEGYLAWKYGLEGDLPSDHPYKNVEPTAPTAGAWNPLNMSAQALRQWIDATNESTVTLNGSYVSEISDSSGNGYSATQTTASEQPAYIDGSAGKKAVDLSSPTAGNLDLGVPTLSTNASYLIVMKESEEQFIPIYVGGRYSGVCDSDSADVNINDTTTGASVWYKNGNIAAPATRADAYSLFAGNELVMMETRGIDFSAWTTSWGIGYHSASWEMEGEIYEFYVLGEEITLEELQKLEGYIAHKYSLEGSLPAAHPYRNSAPKTSAPTYSPFNDGAQVILDFQDSSSVTLNGSDISEVSSQASTEFGVFEQTNAVQQPLYNTNDSDAGGFKTMDTDDGVSTKQGLEAQDEITFGDIYFVMTYKDGTDSTFDSYSNLMSDPATTANRILGNNGTADLFTGTVYTSQLEINGASSSNTVLPMPFSIVRASNATAGTGVLDLFFVESSGSRDWEGSLAYMAIFPEKLDAEANTRVLNYLSNKFNITLS